MSTANLCPQCGKPLPSDGPQGQCPACLLKAALASQSTETSPAIGLHDSTTAVEIGAHLKYFGDYELVDEIARGGMGVVWKARQTSLKRDVAVKMIRAGALASPEEVARFLREAEAAANLQHPNIVAIHEVGEHDGQHYFSMDLVTGRDLGACLKDGPLPPQIAARYVKIIAEAIQFAHQCGILHRDLKPQNVLIDANDQPRITDFGLAKLTQENSRLTQSGVVMGSPSYMPPEQAAGRHSDIGPASDVYSLGAVLYELLTGRPPFRGATVLDTLRDVVENEPAEPRQLIKTIPLDLETICMKCLEKTPSARYPTARALAEELDRFLKGEPIQAKPAGSVRKLVSWVGRHPGILAAAAALVMVALAFGVLYLLEENAFLRASKADPTLARVPGPRHESSRFWSRINLCAMFVGVVVLFAMRTRARGLSFEESLNVDKAGQPTPLGERTRTFAIGAGFLLVGCGVMCLVTRIQAHVWEGESLIRGMILIYWTIYCGIATLGIVIRDYRLVHYGAASRQLNPEQIASIRAVLEDWNVESAIDLYREAIPDANWDEAFEYVVDFGEKLRAENPGKFEPLPSILTLDNLDWTALCICALVEAVILGVLWFIWPPSYPAVWYPVSRFAYSFLAGMGIVALFCTGGVRKGLLLLVAALLVMVVSEMILSRTIRVFSVGDAVDGVLDLAVQESASSWLPYLLGGVFGFVLMIFAICFGTGKGIRNEPGSK